MDHHDARAATHRFVSGCDEFVFAVTLMIAVPLSFRASFEHLA
jgi:hypothetical protein